MEVGVRELKQKLSEYLRLVAKGERIIVTDRGRPAAILAPLPGGDNIARGIEQGWITKPRSAGPPAPPPRRCVASATVAQMIDEDRGTE
ncbi:type II toxin-antitoxin system Phd/YefM family antitoxin [soil metagenome]